jgi:membrane associated rhomboid family serine protease
MSKRAQLRRATAACPSGTKIRRHHDQIVKAKVLDAGGRDLKIVSSSWTALAACLEPPLASKQREWKKALIRRNFRELTEGTEQSWVEVARFRDYSAADQHALVLVAAGIDCQIVANDGLAAIKVKAGDAARAFAELAAYSADNRRLAPVPLDLLAPRAGLAGALIYSCTLLFVYGAAERQMFSRDWLAAGNANAGLIADGELWRALTALTLHGGYGHLFSNLIAGVFLGIVLSQILGSGLGWLLILLAGALGNGLSALLQPATYMAIGASTAVFGTVGILAVLMTRYQRSLWRRGLRRWVPIAAGVMLLAFLGMEGERIDIGGHIAGFAAGCLIGAALLVVGERSTRQHGIMQVAFGAAALILLAGAWLVALA